MDSHMIERLLRLSKKTGSPVILANKDGSDPSVLMSLETYEAMIDGFMLSEEDFDEEEDAFQDFEEEPFSGIPLQEIDQDLPFVGEESLDEPWSVPTKGSREDSTTFEDIPFDPPIPESPQRTIRPVEDVNEERFYLEPIE